MFKSVLVHTHLAPQRMHQSLVVILRHSCGSKTSFAVLVPDRRRNINKLRLHIFEFKFIEFHFNILQAILLKGGWVGLLIVAIKPLSSKTFRH